MSETALAAVAGVAAAIATTISGVNIYRHLKTWVRPRAQKNIVRILAVVNCAFCFFSDYYWSIVPMLVFLVRCPSTAYLGLCRWWYLRYF